MILFVYLKYYKSASTYLFLFKNITTYNTCVILILGGGKLEYYKSMGESQKEGRILKFQWG